MWRNEMLRLVKEKETVRSATGEGRLTKTRFAIYARVPMRPIQQGTIYFIGTVNEYKLEGPLGLPTWYQAVGVDRKFGRVTGNDPVVVATKLAKRAEEVFKHREFRAAMSRALGRKGMR
jgi:hypothetical protein